MAGTVTPYDMKINVGRGFCRARLPRRAASLHGTPGGEPTPNAPQTARQGCRALRMVRVILREKNLAIKIYSYYERKNIVMNRKTRRPLATLLAIAMVMGMLLALPMTASASAMTASQVAHVINIFDPGNGGAKTGQFSASVNGNTVTVTGNVADATNALTLYLHDGVTVKWSASFSGRNATYLIHMFAWGTLEIPTGGLIENLEGAGGDVIRGSAAATVKVTGGTVRSKDSICINGGDVEVTGGRVECEGIRSAIATSGSINISGGIVISANGTAIEGNNDSQITISNGVVRGADCAIAANNSVTITGGLLESSGSSANDATVRAPSLSMSDGIIRNTGAGNGIYNTHMLGITGGTISANSGYAITNGNEQAQWFINGGFIFAQGNDTVITESAYLGSAVVRMNGEYSIIDSPAVVCAWDNSAGKDEYIIDTSTDLKVYPEEATVQWAIEESFVRPPLIIPGLPFGAVSSTSFVRPSTVKTYGIRYSYNGNEGFFEIEGIKVIEEEVIAEHTVTFNSNGGSSVASQTVAAGGKVTKPSDPTKTDSTFGGWYSDSELTNAYDFNANVTANITLYAKWDTAPTTFTVTFNSNGGSAVTSQTVATGGKVTKPADPTKSGNTFAGWFSNAALTTPYNFDTAVTANLTLYAKWEASTSGGASLAETGSMDNFQKSRDYTAGMFNDINEDAWYGYNKEKAVANAYEYGLMSGYPDNTFRPTGNITVAEAITVAARVHRIYTTGADDFVQGIPWFQVYIDYAISNGIIYASDFTTFNQLATRREMAYIFANALPKSEFTKQNTVNSLPDVSVSTTHSSSIFMLYEAGVIGGSDTAGTFNPGNNITRAEAAAIISRVILPSERFSGRTYG
ncbi:MAG: InlB B-repeat-containing protein [Oscillospiraceae bacterium]|nr:InlB B-repeat-containing protein [Oscillospiraceae bacterium]